MLTRCESLLIDMYPRRKLVAAVRVEDHINVILNRLVDRNIISVILFLVSAVAG